MTGSAAILAGAALPRQARANVPVPYSWQQSPPTTSREAFISWMVANRGEDPKILAMRWDRYLFLKANHDFVNDRNGRAFLLNPRDEFVMKRDIARAYDRDFHDIGFGVTISGPLVVSRMTSTIDVQFGEKVLEIGTGSGNQSGYLANLTDKVWTIEIIKPLAERTRGIYDNLISRGYTEFKAINTKQADGYYGWEEAGPFDKIIVTCGIDHIPPPLLEPATSERPHGDSGRAARRPRHPEDREAAKPRRLDPGRALERLQQGRALRPLHQAARRCGQGHARRPALSASHFSRML